MRALRLSLILATVIFAAVATVVAGGQGTTDDQWKLPANAAQEVNPIASSPAVVAQGRKIYEDKCVRCHAADGRGRGPDADPEHPAGNFTDRLRVGFNPDGVMFHKIWNGRENPKMPSFRKEGLSKQEVWTVIHFLKTFRK